MSLVAPIALRCSIPPISSCFICSKISYSLPTVRLHPSKSFSSFLSLRRFLSMASATQPLAQSLTTGDPSSDVNILTMIQSHQEKAVRLPPVEEIRTLLANSLRGMLSTFSQVRPGKLKVFAESKLRLPLTLPSHDDNAEVAYLLLCSGKKYEGYPSGSMVDFACDENGFPILAISRLAVHTKDLLANPRCSLLVAKDPEDRTDLVITLHGDAVSVSEEDREAVRSAYLAKHPNAFWVDFGDFEFVRIMPKIVRYVSGVATALLGSGEFSREDYSTAEVDPIYQFSKPIASHMNKDHAEDTKLIVQFSTSIPVESAFMQEVDSLGFNVKASCQGSTYKLRIPFPRRAVDRKDVKTLIIEMLEAAKSHGS